MAVPGRTCVMKLKDSRTGLVFHIIRNLAAVICSVVLAPGDMRLLASPAPQEAAAAGTEATATVPPDHLDSLAAPIAPHPHPTLSQTLVASTYPLEIIRLPQWP